MAAAEKEVLEKGGSRSEGLKAVRDYFYQGPVAQAIVAMHQAKGGLISQEDLADFSGYWEEPFEQGLCRQPPCGDNPWEGLRENA